MRMRSQLVEQPLSWARSRWGRHDINWTPEFMGFGNQLYLWCWAFERRDLRPAPKVLINERTRPWLAHVPGFADRFLVERSEVGLWDRRGHYWAEKERISGHAQGFSREARSTFIGALREEPLLAGIEDSPLSASDVLTVNVRRGDYYSVAAHRAWFAIDLAAYLELAIAGAIARDGHVSRIHVVSDDQAWSAAALRNVIGPGVRVTHSSPGDPVGNFRDVCAARRIVISNSTFSLWGAFVSREVHGQDAGEIWAPAFFQSTYPPGRCVEYDRDFSFVDTLPGGWQPNWVLSGSAASARP